MEQNKIAEAVNKLFNISTNNYIFIYTPPKVGSTTLVTSLRVSLNKSYNTIHIHDEIMLSVLTGIHNVKINDIIEFLSNQGKNVYVIDVYRTPIERKMSEYFEKISPYHFNNSTENINKYSMKRIVERFNKIFPHIENDDHYFDKYNIENIIPFNFTEKYTLQKVNNIKYIKLRLCDSGLWSSILSKIFQTDIVIIPDYKTENKPIGELYNRFKAEYKIPANHLELIKNDKYLHFYYDELERKSYIDLWSSKQTDECVPYTKSEFDFYLNLCLDNQYFSDIDIDHYIDNGCFCEFCTEKRREIYFRAKAGEKITEKIIHREVIYNEKINKINNIAKQLKNMAKQPIKSKYKPQQFKINITHK